MSEKSGDKRQRLKVLSHFQLVAFFVGGLNQMKKDDDFIKDPLCGNCIGAPPLEFTRIANGVLIHSCKKCGGGSVAITVKAWKMMKAKPKRTVNNGCKIP